MYVHRRGKFLIRISTDTKGINPKLGCSSPKSIPKVYLLLANVGSAAYRKEMITRAQIRAARGLIGWTQAHLAQASGVSAVAIKNLERGVTDPRVSTISNIETAFDQAGVIFLDAGDIRDGGVGVRLKNRGGVEP